jgi:hypothetical protein
MNIYISKYDNMARHNKINNNVEIDLEKELQKINLYQSSSIKNFNKKKYISSSESDTNSESLSDLEIELENKLPCNYGNKWTDSERKILINSLKTSEKIVLDDVNKNKINGIAKKLGRSDGGVIAEIKKIIYDKYTNGNSVEIISDDLNLVYKDVKSIIKIYLEKECENEIINFEKENKLLKLKIENIKLRNELNALQS